MYVLIAIGLSVLAGSIWLQIWQDPSIVIVLGIGIIIFGYWWKWTMRAMYAGPYVEESMNKIREKEHLNKELTFHEKDALLMTDKSYIVIHFTKKLGLAVIAIGILLKIFS